MVLLAEPFSLSADRHTDRQTRPTPRRRLYSRCGLLYTIQFWNKMQYRSTACYTFFKLEKQLSEMWKLEAKVASLYSRCGLLYTIQFWNKMQYTSTACYTFFKLEKQLSEMWKLEAKVASRPKVWPPLAS